MSSPLSGTDRVAILGIFVAALVGLFLFYNSPKPETPDSEVGVLILAHGGNPKWNKTVEEAAKNVRGELKKEIAFGMAKAETIQPAIDRLEKRGVKGIVIIPLFLSSSSELFRQLEYVLGLRDEPDVLFTILMKEAINKGSHHTDANHPSMLKQVRFSVPFILRKAIDYDPLVASILAERIKGLGLLPHNLSIFLTAHGPVSEEDNKDWILNLRLYARDLSKQFKGISVLTHTIRDDAPNFIKELTGEIVRKKIRGEQKMGREVVVIPYLLASGGREEEIKRIFSECKCRILDKALLPHPNISLWIKQQIQTGKKKLTH